jgi:hypothetical protein
LSEGCAPSPVHDLLAVRFNDRPDARTMTLNSLYSLLVEVEYSSDSAAAAAAGAPFEGAFVQNHPVLAWLASNTKKYPPLGSRGAGPRREVWTLLSTASYAKLHKVPQEALEGTDACRDVTAAMLDAAAPFLKLAAPAKGSGGGGGHVVATKLQLWGAGVPLNSWVATDGSAFVWDASGGLGACGDWLWPHGASIEGAYMSGRRLADHMATLLPAAGSSSDADGRSRGLAGAFAAGAGGLGAVGEKAQSAAPPTAGKGARSSVAPGSSTGGRGGGTAGAFGRGSGLGSGLRSGRGGEPTAGASGKGAQAAGAKAKPNVPEMRPGDWLCPCGAHVFASKRACFRCQAPKP